MKEVVIKSLRINITSTVIYACVCVGLIAVCIVQNVQFHKMLTQQTDKCTELMITQQPGISEFPNRKLGKLNLSC